jgi:cytochrome c peroxidase
MIKWGFVWGVLMLAWSCESPEDLSAEHMFPKDNPPSAQKIELGRALFFDKRLSRDESIACANCHNPAFAFTDRKTVSDGIDGKHPERNASTLLNSVFLQTVMFDAHLKTLELQVLVPIQ